MTLVFRSRRGLSLRPVNRIKHVTDKQFATALGVTEVTNLVVSTDTPVLANSAECETGSTVNAIYLRVEVVNTGTTGVLANCYMIVYKNPGGNLTIPAGNVVGGSDNKKYVIHQEMVMLNMTENGNPRTLFQGVIVIPRGYRRNGPNDLINVDVFSPGVEITGCIQSHYKEFR